MKSRLGVAGAVIVLAAITLVVLRFFSGSPPALTSTTRTTTAMPATPPTTASAMASIVPSAAPSSPEDMSGGSPSPTPSPSPSRVANPNLLSATNGAFVRSWTVGGLQDNPQNLPQDTGSIALTPSFNRPVALLYELPAIAHLDRIGISLRGEKPARVKVAIGTDVHHLRDVGTVPIALPTDGDTERILVVAADARFVRFTITKTANDPLRVASITAAGAPGAPQRGALNGLWLNLAATATATQFGGMRGHVPDKAPSLGRNDDQRAAVEEDGRFMLFRCFDRYDPWQATLNNGIARGGAGALQLAGDGNLLVGNDGNQAILAVRAKALPACGSSSAGRGLWLRPSCACSVKMRRKSIRRPSRDDVSKHVLRRC